MVWLITLICAFLPAYQVRFKIVSLPMTLLEAMILICFFTWLFIKIKEIGFKKLILEKWQEFKNWRWLILAWLVLAAASIFIAPDLKAAAGVWKAYFLEPILFLIVLNDVVKTEKEKNLVLGGLFFSALYLSLFVFYQKFFGGGVMSLEIWKEAKIWRATSLFPQPNFLGLYLGPIVVLAVGQLIFNVRKIRHSLLVISCWLLVIGLSLSAIILARSEGALVGIFFGCLFFFLIFQKSPRKVFLISSLILVLIIFSLPFLRGPVLKKISFNDLSIQLRINIWQGAFSLLKTSPFLGVGLMGYQKLIPQYQKPYNSKTGELISVETHPYPHNLYLTIWLELGLLGLLVFFSLIINFFVLIFKDLLFSSRPLLLGLGGAMIVLLIHGLVDTPYFKNDSSVLFWLIIGLGLIETNLRKGG